jgi:hypothetical protein
MYHKSSYKCRMNIPTSQNFSHNLTITPDGLRTDSEFSIRRRPRHGGLALSYFKPPFFPTALLAWHQRVCDMTIGNCDCQRRRTGVAPPCSCICVEEPRNATGPPQSQHAPLIYHDLWMFRHQVYRLKPWNTVYSCLLPIRAKGASILSLEISYYDWGFMQFSLYSFWQTQRRILRNLKYATTESSK